MLNLGRFRTCVTAASDRAAFRPTWTQLAHQPPKITPTLVKRVASSAAVTVGAGVGQGLAAGVGARSRRLVGWWLAGCAGACFGAVILGGLTRLTESGLSMTDWHLWKERPPLSHAEWLAEFERYKQFPEFEYRDAEFSLGHFQFIWWMEYAHRTWGRCIGGLFLLPATYFWARGHLSPAMKRRVPFYGALLLGQGLLGWYMVRSGLHKETLTRDVPAVSQYRLAAHLGSAIFLYANFVWAALGHLLPPVSGGGAVVLAPAGRALLFGGHGLVALVYVTALSGAFVAGLDAGLVYNSWPKMADRWIPEDVAALTPAWRNLFENASAVQFDHRLLGHSTAAVALAMWWRCARHPAAQALPHRLRLAAHCVLGAVTLQVTLGVSTLLTYVPTPLAASHQSGSLVLLSCALWLLHEIKRLPK